MVTSSAQDDDRIVQLIENGEVLEVSCWILHVRNDFSGTGSVMLEVSLSVGHIPRADNSH